MATVNLSPLFNGWQGFGNDGKPLNGGFIYTYAAGTSTLLETYTTAAGNVQNTNPIELDPSGRPPQEIWLVQGSAYFFILQDSLHNQIETFDNISGIEDAGSTGDLEARLASTASASVGAGMVGQSILRAYAGGTMGRQVSAWVTLPPATGTDDTANLSAAVTELLTVSPGGGEVLCPPGEYIIDQFVFPTTSGTDVKAIHIVGVGGRATIFRERTANGGLFAGQAVVTATYATAANVIRGIGLKPHASSSTSYAIDMRRMSYTQIEDIEFIDNGTGRFAVGIYMDTESGTGHCYENTIDGVRVNNQTWGPALLIRGVGTPNLHKIKHVSCVGSMPMNGIQVDTTAVMWDIDGLHWEGPVGTAIFPCNYMTVRNSYIESTTTSVDATGRTSMNVQFERCYFNSAPFAGNAGTTYSFDNCFDSTGTIKTNQFQGGGAFGNTNFLFPSSGGLSLDGTNRQMRAATITVAAGATAQFSPWSTQGNAVAFVVNDNAEAFIVQTRGGSNAVALISNPQSAYSTTAGNPATINVYWSAGNSRYEVQNNAAASRTLTILFVATN